MFIRDFNAMEIPSDIMLTNKGNTQKSLYDFNNLSSIKSQIKIWGQRIIVLYILQDCCENKKNMRTKKLVW